MDGVAVRVPGFRVRGSGAKPMTGSIDAGPICPSKGRPKTEFPVLTDFLNPEPRTLILQPELRTVNLSLPALKEETH
jgi:hypothetical protein